MDINVGGLIVMIVFYIGILAIGIWAGIKRKKGEEEAMLAGRSIGLFLGTCTLTATWVGGGFLNGTAEMVYSRGLVFCQAPWGYSLSLFFAGIFFAKILREREYFTFMDPFESKYGKHMVALLYIPELCGDLFYTGCVLNALGATVSVILGVDKSFSVIGSAGIVMLYTMFGGLYSVAYTDVIQLIFITIGLILSIPFALGNKAVEPISSTSSDWLGTWSVPDTGKWIDDALLLMFGGIPWQGVFQRVLSSKNPRVSQIISVSGCVGCLMLAIPAVILGAIGYSTDWSQTGLYSPPPNVTNYTLPSPDPSLILPLVLRYLTPNWVGIIGMAAVAAAVMSSADSNMLATSTIFARNIYRPLLRPRASSSEIVWVMRIAIVFVAVLGCTLALTVESIYALFYLCSDLVYVMLFPQFVCVIYLRHSNVYGSFSGYIVGLILRVLGGERVIGIPAIIEFPLYSETYGQRFPFKTLAMVCTFITIVAVSFLTKYLFENNIAPTSWDFFSVFNFYDVLNETEKEEQLSDSFYKEDHEKRNLLTK